MWAFGKLDVPIPRLLPRVVQIACAPEPQRHSAYSLPAMQSHRQLLGQAPGSTGSAPSTTQALLGAPEQPRSASASPLGSRPASTELTGPPQAASSPAGSVVSHRDLPTTSGRTENSNGAPEASTPASGQRSAGDRAPSSTGGGPGGPMTSQGHWNLRDLVDLYWTCARLSLPSLDVRPLTLRVLERLSSGEPCQSLAEDCWWINAPDWRHGLSLSPLQDMGSWGPRLDAVYQRTVGAAPPWLALCACNTGGGSECLAAAQLPLYYRPAWAQAC